MDSDDETPKKKKVSAKEADEKAQEKARAKDWLPIAKRLIQPLFASGKIGREDFKGLLSTTMKQPFNSNSDKINDLAELKACLDKSLAKFKLSKEEKRQQDDVFKEILKEFAKETKTKKTPPKGKHKQVSAVVWVSAHDPTC